MDPQKVGIPTSNMVINVICKWKYTTNIVLTIITMFRLFEGDNDAGRPRDQSVLEDASHHRCCRVGNFMPIGHLCTHTSEASSRSISSNFLI